MSDEKRVLTLLKKAREALKRSDAAAVRRYAEQAARLDPDCEEAWMLLAAVASPRASVVYLQRALAINPQNERARKGLEWAEKRLARAAPVVRALRSDDVLEATARRRVVPVPKEAPIPRRPRRRRPWLPLALVASVVLTILLVLQGNVISALAQADPTATPQPWVTVVMEKPTQTAQPSPTPQLPTMTPSPTATPSPLPPTASPTALPTTPPPAVTPTPLPTATPSAEDCENLVGFVKDITYPDGTQVKAGETFVKTWRLKNLGTCAWTPDYVLVFDRGDRMSGGPELPIGRTVLPGETIDLSLELAAPQANGLYTGYWRLRTPQGETFALEGGQSFWVEVRVGPPPTPTPAPAPTVAPPSSVDPNERWIDVDLSEQRLYAYEGNRLVNSFLVSTGTWQHPTVTGQYRIYVKYRYTDMAGPGYYLPNVPYTMYFYQGYGIHGTYWHNNFGTPMSHGCVNMRTEEAGWLFNWASVGTLVNVHP